MHARTHAHMKKLPDEKQTGSEVQAEVLAKKKKIVGIFYVVVVVPILWDLLAAGNDGLEYRLP